MSEDPNAWREEMDAMPPAHMHGRHRGRRRDDEDRSREADEGWRRTDAKMTLVRPEQLHLPRRPIGDGDLEGIDDPWERLMREANVLCPVTAITYIPDGFQLAFRAVQFDAEFTSEDRKSKSNGTFYLVGRGDNERLALHKVPLRHLANLAALSDVPDGTRRMDDGSEDYLWEWQSTVRMLGLDGVPREVTQTRSLDLRDGQPEATDTKWGQNRGEKTVQPKDAWSLHALRKNGAAKCESLAKNRAIRDALGIRGGYTYEEARRPFVIPVLVPIAASHMPAAFAAMMGREVQTGSAHHPSSSAATTLPDHGIAPDVIDGIVEEEERERVREAAPPPREEPRRARAAPAGDAECAECGRPLTERVAAYSMKHFGDVLCHAHQPAG